MKSPDDSDVPFYQGCLLSVAIGMKMAEDPLRSELLGSLKVSTAGWYKDSYHFGKSLPSSQGDVN